MANLREVAILFGGSSSEYDGSVATCRFVREQLLKDRRLRLSALYLFSPAGGIYELEATADISGSELPRHNPRSLSAAELGAELLTSQVFALNLIHGQIGEDGCLSGWAHVAGIKTSCGSPAADAICLNKWVSNALVRDFLWDEVSVPRSFLITKEGRLPPQTDRDGWIRAPLVVKPGGLGASLFVAKFSGWHEAAASPLISEILTFSRSVLVQEYISGREFSCGVVQTADGAHALPVVSLDLQTELFDHSQKHGMTHPAFIRARSGDERRLQEVSVRLFELFECFGWARFDFRMRSDNVFFLEANTVPGLMAGSLFTRMLELADMTVGDLVLLLIEADAARPVLKHRIAYNIEDP